MYCSSSKKLLDQSEKKIWRIVWTERKKSIYHVEMSGSEEFHTEHMCIMCSVPSKYKKNHHIIQQNYMVWEEFLFLIHFGYIIMMKGTKKKWLGKPA